MEQDNLTSSDFYTSQRSHLSIHEYLLHDTPVVNKFKEILANPQIIEGKTILEIGAGTGLFSMIAAREGRAKHVYAWEPSKMSIYAAQNVKDNQLNETVTVLTGPLDSLRLDEHVDIIFTTSFNFGLVFESLYSDFIKAKTLFGNENTILLPNKISLFIVGATQSFLKTPSYWNNDVYGFNYTAMNSMNDHLAETTLMAPCRICTNTCEYLTIDTNGQCDPCNLFGSFDLEVSKEGILQCFTTWFDLSFLINGKEVFISTSPYESDTHWVQLSFALRKTIQVNKGDCIKGTLTISIINQYSKPILFDINYSINSSESTEQRFSLN